MRFIKPQHPTANVAPTREALERLMKTGLQAQRKVHGHRAQIHIEEGGRVLAYTRQGPAHTSALPPEALLFLRSLPAGTVLDCEWQKDQRHLYVFDLLAIGGRVLSGDTYLERIAQLPLLPAAAPFSFLPLIGSLDEAWAVLQDDNRYTEGIVLRNVRVPGFSDKAIVRCRRSGAVFEPLRSKERAAQ